MKAVRQCKRAVAPAISTVILVGATIAIAIAAYQYVASSLAISQARANFEDAKEAFKEMARWLNTFAFTEGASQSIPLSLAHGMLEKQPYIIDIEGLGTFESYELRFYGKVQGYEEVLYGDKSPLIISPDQAEPIPIAYVDQDVNGRWFVAINTSRIMIIDQGNVTINDQTYRKYSILMITIDDVEFSGSGTTFNVKIVVSDVEYKNLTPPSLSQISIDGETYNFPTNNIVVLVHSHIKIIVSS